jgi:hypothetical protein
MFRVKADTPGLQPDTLAEHVGSHGERPDMPGAQPDVTGRQGGKRPMASMPSSERRSTSVVIG